MPEKEKRKYPWRTGFCFVCIFGRGLSYFIGEGIRERGWRKGWVDWGWELGKKGSIVIYKRGCAEPAICNGSPKPWRCANMFT